MGERELEAWAASASRWQWCKALQLLPQPRTMVPASLGRRCRRAETSESAKHSADTAPICPCCPEGANRVTGGAAARRRHESSAEVRGVALFVLPLLFPAAAVSEPASDTSKRSLVLGRPDDTMRVLGTCISGLRMHRLRSAGFLCVFLGRAS